MWGFKQHMALARGCDGCQSVRRSWFSLAVVCPSRPDKWSQPYNLKARLTSCASFISTCLHRNDAMRMPLASNKSLPDTESSEVPIR